jgi:hypothetical protein
MSNRNRPSGGNPRLDEFPDNFDDMLFHVRTIELNDRLPILRGKVFKTFKNAIDNRIDGYKGDIPLKDKFDVVFTVKDSGFSLYQWGIIREELLERGFDPINNYDDNGNLVEITTTVERTLNLDKSLEERMAESREGSDDEDEDKDKKEE